MMALVKLNLNYYYYPRVKANDYNFIIKSLMKLERLLKILKKIFYTRLKGHIYIHSIPRPIECRRCDRQVSFVAEKRGQAGGKTRCHGPPCTPLVLL